MKAHVTKLPETLGLQLQNRDGRFMHQCGRRMPWLDLLTEQDLDFGGVLGFEDREDGVVDCVEEFGGVGADIVEVELEGVEGWWSGEGGRSGC